MRYQLKASPIEARTKGEVRRLRLAGYIPVSVQHRGEPTVHLMEETRPLQEFIQHHGQSAMIELTIEPGKQRHNVMVHSLQRDPLTQRIIQVTYQKIEKTDVIHTQVPLHFVGEPEAVKRGVAIAQHPLETVEIRCSQAHLPEQFVVDCSQMQVGDVLRISDVAHDKNVTIVTAGDSVIVSLKLAPVAQEPETVEEAGAEPEVAPEAEAEESAE